MNDFMILRRADPDPLEGHRTANLKGSGAEAGRPVRVPLETKKPLPPADLYDGTHVRMSARALISALPGVVAIASRPLYERLEHLAPGTMTTIAADHEAVVEALRAGDGSED